MSLLIEKLKEAKTVAIIGHVNPDGDCVGSCLALYNYISDNFQNICAYVFLEPVPEKFSYMSGYEEIINNSEKDFNHDLCVCLDSSDRERLGKFVKYLDSANNAVCLDHHISNTLYTADNVVKADASSTCEVLYEQLDAKKISRKTAECIYTGIIHDTGVFKHSSTSKRTMEIAGEMMEKGIDFSYIIDDSFYKKTYIQNQILGRALLESMTVLGGKCILSVLRKKDMDFYGVTGADTDGIIDQLRVTDGVECAIFIYETGTQQYKVSMRSNSYLNVCTIATYFGGGGHVRAAGCSMSGSVHDVINNLTTHIEKQMKATKEDV